MKRFSSLFLAFFSLVPALSQAATTKAYPEIIAVYSEVSFEGKSPSAGRCTGTYIAPHLLLTASHCVRHFNVNKVNGVVYRATDMANNPVPDLTARPEQVYVLEKKWWGTKKVHPLKVHVSDQAIPVEHGDLTLDSVEQDLAILEFAREYPTPREIAESKPAIGAPVVMVGFGHHGFLQPSGAGVGGTFPTKFIGTNWLSMAELDMLVVNGSNTTCDDPETATKDWSICHGDSGGPLIDAETGKILGVASTSGSMRDGRKMSVYTDITSADAVRFIESVKHGQ